MYTQDTPNPLALKFILGKPVVEEGYYLFSSLSEAQGLGPVEDILSLPGIDSVLLTPDFITVNKTQEVPWTLLESIILSALQHHLESFPLSPLAPPADIKQDRFAAWAPPDENIAAICQEIEALLESRVRPAIESDGGMISLKAFEEGVVYVTLQGACSGCPMSEETLKGGIEQTLKYYIPEVESVRVVV